MIIKVRIPDDAAEKLRDLAYKEMRDTAQQAGWLILEGLARRDLPVDGYPLTVDLEGEPTLVGWEPKP